MHEFLINVNKKETIVRCKDCRNWNSKDKSCDALSGFGRYWWDNDFCSHGERRK